jgi:hypothetical protein
LVVMKSKGKTEQVAVVALDSFPPPSGWLFTRLCWRVSKM